jgi:molybdopterin-guanine dinucleotide biosynthesis protein A
MQHAMRPGTGKGIGPAGADAVAGLLLMGGQSRRMGRDKAQLWWPPAAAPLWERQHRLLREVADPVWRAVGPGPGGGAEVLVDAEAGAGPLPAIRAALARGPAWLVVLAVDLPLVETALLERLLRHRQRGGITLPEADGRRQPLCAVWHRAVAPVVADVLATGSRRVDDVVRAVPVTVETLREHERRWLLNVNRAEDWEAALAASAPRARGWGDHD